jgi:site-specific recombinase XerD
MSEMTELQAEAWLASFASSKTRAAYRSDLSVFLAWCDAQQINPLHATAEHVAQFRFDVVTAGARESTARRRASAVAGFLRAHQPAELEGQPAAGDGTSSTGVLSDDDRDRILGVLPDQSAKAQVLVALLLLDGLKLDEILDLDVPDISGQLPHLDAHVSRDTAAALFSLHPTTSRFLHGHLGDRSAGPLLVGRRGAEARLTRFGADYLVKQAGRDAGLDAPLTTNVLRRSFVSHAHHSGQAVDDIRRRVGHHDVRTTRRLFPSPGDGHG